MKHASSWLSAAVLAVSLVCTVAPAQTPAQKKKATKIMRNVAMLLPNAHLTRRELDDKVSGRAFPIYLESLDPLKVYFKKSDITEFEASRSKLDDMLQAADMKFARTVWNRYVARLAERVEWTREIVDGGQDFSIDEEFHTDPDTIDYPADNKAAKERWRKRIKYDLLRLKGDETPDDEAKETINRRYRGFLRRTRQLDDEDILATFLTSISAGYDPHTTYMSARRLEDFEINMRLNYQGIGARLMDEDGIPEVSSIMPGGAAKKAGELKAKDKILAVAQGDGEFVSVIGMRLNDAVQKIRGKEKTVVRLKVRRKGVKDPFVISITRAKTELQDQKALSKVFDVDAPKGSDGGKIKVGVIDLPGFYGSMGFGNHRSCSKDVRALLQKFEKEKVDVCVLDLRYNGGGLLNEAVELTGLFIDEGPVVQVKGFRRNVDVLEDEDAGVAWNGPLVVLISRFSASASEIVAGAIKDYGRGLVVGDESSHGKGTVQRVLDIGRLGGQREKLGALKLTVQQFYRPDGLSTQVRGVRSDVRLPSFTNEVSEGEKELDYAVPFGEISPKRHDEHGMVTKKIVAEVTKRSATRRADDKYFKKLERDIARYRERKDRKSVTLNLKKYLDLVKSIESDEEKVREQTQSEDELKRDIKLDGYMKEILQIARDYRETMGKRRVAVKR